MALPGRRQSCGAIPKPLPFIGEEDNISPDTALLMVSILFQI